MSIRRYALAALISILAAQAHAERILIAAEDDWAPYSAKRADSPEPDGFTPTLVREIFARRNIEVEFVTVPFSRCLHYAETGHTVACFNVTITEANRNKFYWHPPRCFTKAWPSLPCVAAFNPS
jgi:polar amino acid transport system substrate-binding protein